MRWPAMPRPARTPRARRPARFGNLRDRLAVLLAVATAVTVLAVALFSDAAQFKRMLMPGPLASAHGAIEDCSGCHTRSGSGKLSWLSGLIAGDPSADSKACLACHTMPTTAFNPHGASVDALKRATDRLRKFADASTAPAAIQAQSRAFPTDDIVAGGLHCATCHQEHQGTDFNLAKISSAQCQSCHVAQFDSFANGHPKLERYPFRRRTRIVYDHAGHFDKHFPEVARKDPDRRIPATCSACHDAKADKRVMGVAPFEQTCTACHRDQITGKERVSGPKGIAFFSLPGLDLEALKKHNAAIGEWPETSEAELTPFMKVMIGRSERGRALVKAVDGLSLNDLAGASAAQIKAVGELALEIKRLLHQLIKEPTSDVLAGLDAGGRGKLDAALVADLTARIPRDVLVAAQNSWLPNLAAEMANGRGAVSRQQGGRSSGAVAAPAATIAPSAAAPASKAEAVAAEPSEATERALGSEAKPDESPRRSAASGEAKIDREAQSCLVRVLGQCLVQKEQKPVAGGAASSGATPSPAGAAVPAAAGAGQPPARTLPPAMQAGLRDLRQIAEAGAARSETTGKLPQASTPARGPAPAGQVDDLLRPSEDELKEIRAHGKLSGRQPRSTAAPAGAAGADGGEAPTPSSADTGAGPQSVSGIDPESWAEAGGWYQQDHTIYYRPAGHKDKFIASWLLLTGPQAGDRARGPAAAVFEALTGKDAQGSCTKCHSVDAVPGGGRVVNFAPLSIAGKQGGFTRFVHEPHFVAVGDQGCLTCHKIARTERYLKGYQQGNPLDFVGEFGPVTKDRCESCHSGSKARQDCLLCHVYHVNDVVTPIPGTKLEAR